MKNKYNNSNKAFTLVELLVVIAIIAMLLSILIPSLSVARSQGRMIVCQSNIRQLAMANIGYTTENDGYCVPAASDLYLSNPQGGYNRWHGMRKDENSPFDPLKGPLSGYLGDGEVKECSEKVKFVKGLSWGANFEQGGGGYGYNMTYIGSRLWKNWSNENYKKTAKITEIFRTAETIMFADSAMANTGQNGDYIHEYSFLEPPYFVSNGNPVTSWGLASPSIHFRHRGKANIVWADGHTSSAKRLNFNGTNAYGVVSADFDIGWFGLFNNSLFDIK